MDKSNYNNKNTETNTGTTIGLLDPGLKKPCRLGKRRSRSRLRVCLCVCWSTVLLASLACAAILLLDVGAPVRCLVASWGVKVFEPCHQATSLGSGALGFVYNSTGIESGNMTSDYSVTDTTLSAEDEGYLARGQQAWEAMWRMLHDTEGWRSDSGKDLHTGRVSSKTYKGVGKVARLEAYIDSSPSAVFRAVYTDIERATEWQSTTAVSQILHHVTPSTDIYYMASKPIGGGIISSRDFVSVRHFETHDNLTVHAVTAVEYPGAPSAENVVRGEGRPSGVAYYAVPDNPNKCRIVMFVSVHFGGWIPQWLVDKAVTMSLFDFLKDLRSYLSNTNM